jgi:hypothetical protein
MLESRRRLNVYKIGDGIENHYVNNNTIGGCGVNSSFVSSIDGVLFSIM